MTKVILNLYAATDGKMKYALIHAAFFPLLFCFCAFSITEVMAQKGVVEGNSLYMTGTLTDHGIYRNNREIQFVKDKETETQVFHPADLEGFSFDNGDVYISKIIDDDGVKAAYFLIEQIRGNANLFALRTRKGFRFFGESNDQLIELKDDGSFRITLSKVLNHCPGFETSFSLVKPTKPSLSRAFSLHNQCYDGVFPRTRVGFTVGYSSTIFEVRDLLYNYVPMQGLSPIFGVFIDTPTGLGPKWFANLQIQYQQNAYRTSRNAPSDFQVNTTCLNFPIVFKYRSTARKFRPFLLAGPTLSYFARHQSNLLEIITNSVPTTYVRSMDNISEFQLSATVGLGSEYSLNLRNSVGLEVRYSVGSGVRKEEENNQRVTSLQLIGSVFF